MGSPCRYTNVPRLRDINTTTWVLRELGVEVAQPAPNDILIDASTLESVTASYELVRTMRASILVLGPLLAKQGKANVSLPGGCAIGARIFMDMVSVGATENLLMAAALADGTTILEN